MKWFSKLAGFALVLLLSVVMPNLVTAQAEPPIVGGVNADQDYSFMVSLQTLNGEHFCGGALLRPQWVVTAAHCLVETPAAQIKVRVGSLDRTRGGEATGVTQLIPYPAYDGSSAGGDIALLRLASSVRAEPIQLGVGAQVGLSSRLLGWGQTCPRKGGCGGPMILQQLDSLVLNSASCKGINGLSEFCVDSPGRVAGACYGDSGGPQITLVNGRWVLLGVTSRAGSSNPTCTVAPTIYTSIEPYAQWLNQNSKS